MNELYWITRLEGINILFITITVISIISLIVTLICYSIESSSSYKDNNLIKIQKKIIKYCIIALFISLPVNIFVPTTKEAYIIYGIGPIVDKLKDNKILNNMPDKAVKYLDEYLDTKTWKK